MLIWRAHRFVIGHLQRGLLEPLFNSILGVAQSKVGLPLFFNEEAVFSPFMSRVVNYQSLALGVRGHVEKLPMRLRMTPQLITELELPKRKRCKPFSLPKYNITR